MWWAVGVFRPVQLGPARAEAVMTLADLDVNAFEALKDPASTLLPVT
jgi:hypothetical protein